MPLIDEAIARAEELRSRGDLSGAAAALDAVAWQDRERVVPLLQQDLERLKVEEHGLVFRYIPAGSFVMGNANGEPDERPAHRVTLPGFWMSEAPLSWDDFARLMDWPAPPARPTEGQLISYHHKGFEGSEDFRFAYHNGSKIRLQYCENDTLRARDWHAHDTVSLWKKGERVMTAQEVFGAPERASDSPYRFDQKPMVAVSWELASLLGRKLTSNWMRYRLPTEAEWERAARGCFRGALYPWGDAPPDATRADFDHFGGFFLRPSRTFRPNDYFLYSMAGGVWEWCVDHYDASFYFQSPEASPCCELGQEIPGREHVLRGGSWADCADVLRVSFRSAGSNGSSPNVGFRLVRMPMGE